MTEKQRSVARNALAGMTLTLFLLVLGIVFIPISWPSEPSAGERLAFALKADTLVIVWLVVCVGRLAQHRFFTPDDIDGGGLRTGTSQAKMLQSMLQNTLEQTLLALTVHLIWVVVMPLSWIAAVPAAAIMFFSGRLLFIHGYPKGAPSRALGFALTFYPSVVMLLTIIMVILINLIW